MKHVLILLLCISTFSIFAQGDDKSKVKELSNAETFTSRSGSLIQKEFAPVGDVKKCKVELMKITDLNTKEILKAVRFEYDYRSQYSTDTKTALLDGDELDGLIVSLKLIQQKIKEVPPTNYTEVTYRSRSGFQAGCFVSRGKWAMFLKLERFDSNSSVYLDQSDIDFLVLIMEDAKKLL